MNVITHTHTHTRARAQKMTVNFKS